MAALMSLHTNLNLDGIRKWLVALLTRQDVNRGFLVKDPALEHHRPRRFWEERGASHVI